MLNCNDPMTPFELIQAVSSIATAIGVAVAASQLLLTKRQAQSQFEDSFAEQYRQILRDIPLGALLGKELEDADLRPHLRTFYEYFDLSNEQAFLSAQGRLRKATWRNWREGIEQHFARPAFQQAWRILAPDLDGSFDELKRLQQTTLSKIAGQPQVHE